MGLVNEGLLGSGRSPRLSEVLFERPDRSFASIAALPSNVEAIDEGLRFSAGLSTFAVIAGPSGWGKSHLLAAVSHRLRSDFGREVEVQPVMQHLGISHLGPLPSDLPNVLLLDDCQEVFGRPRLRSLLRCELERRVRAGKPTLLSFTVPKVGRPLKTLLPSSREWAIHSVEAPDPAERVLLIQQMTISEGLTLSANLIRIIAFQMHGNGRTLAGALKRLRLSQPAWLDSRSTLRACGLLEPFFADNSAWDLRMRIHRQAEVSRAQFGRVQWSDLAVYTMLKEACLPEAAVARYMGMEPAEAYLRAVRFAKEVQEDPVIAGYVCQFVEQVVHLLAND
jgi:hypothetical protein